MEEVSNKTLGVLLVVCIVICLTGTFFAMSNQVDTRDLLNISGETIDIIRIMDKTDMGLLNISQSLDARVSALENRSGVCP